MTEGKKKNLEDVYLAQDRLEQIRSGKTTPIPLDEVMKNYGMDEMFIKNKTNLSKA